MSHGQTILHVRPVARVGGLDVDRIERGILGREGAQGARGVPGVELRALVAGIKQCLGR